MKYCDLCDRAHVPIAARCNRCQPRWWACGWTCRRCFGSCVHVPAEWLRCGVVCQACLDIPTHWRTHDDRRRLRRHLMQRFPEIRMIVRNMAENDHLDESSDYEPMQFSPVHKIRDVLRHLRYCLQLTRFESIIICDGTEMLKQWLRCGVVCQACLDIPTHWRTHDDQRRL